MHETFPMIAIGWKLSCCDVAQAFNYSRFSATILANYKRERLKKLNRHGFIGTVAANALNEQLVDGGHDGLS